MHSAKPFPAPQVPNTTPTAAAEAAPPATSTARWLALGAVAGPILFTLAWIVLGLVSPGYPLFGTWIAPYSIVSQPISGLGLGLTGPYMNAAFVGCGVLTLVGVIGIVQQLHGITSGTRRACATLLALSPIGTAMTGIFTLESMMPHLVGFLLAAASPVLAFLVTGVVLRRHASWRQLGHWLLIASPLTLVLVITFFATFDPVAAGTGQGIGGLTQRVLVLAMHGTFVAIGLSAFRRQGDGGQTA